MNRPKSCVARMEVVVIISFMAFAGLGINRSTEATGAHSAEKAGVKVAVYGGPGVWHESKMAAFNLFKWMNMSVAIVCADVIRHGDLSNFDLLCMPGGWAYDYFTDLLSDGATKIRDFVRGGGAYMGICAGAFYACDYLVWEGSRYDYPMGLFLGHGDGPLKEIPWPEYNMTKINVVNHTHPITASEPEYEWILYYGGPELHAYEGEKVDVLAAYDCNDQPAIVAFNYGCGRVFLSGPHPEIEEDSDRDGVSWGDWLDDQGSDWPLLYQAVKWLVLREDINDDGVVDIVDVAIIGQAFGSYPGHPRWNVNVDLDCNDVINIIDIVKVAKEFGKTI